jgi:uncharacterized Zn finger protein (UPF0148 family)
MFAGYRHCKKCGKALMGLFDGALCDECEEEENRRMKDKDYEQRATAIIMNTIEGVKAQIRKAYNKGYEDGKADTPFTDTEEAENKAYNRGLNDAWDIAKKIMRMDIVEKDAVFAEFGRATYSVILDLSASEAIAKIKAYEDKQKQDAEIKVGDEVTHDGAKFILLNIDSQTSVYCLDKRGRTPIFASIHNLTKTGRHFPQIAEVLAGLRGAENDE